MYRRILELIGPGSVPTAGTNSCFADKTCTTVTAGGCIGAEAGVACSRVYLGVYRASARYTDRKVLLVGGTSDRLMLSWP